MAKSPSPVRKAWRSLAWLGAIIVVLVGLNLVGDGRHVFMPTGAVHLRTELEARGYVCVELDTSELLLGGGSVKCCTQEIRPLTARRPTVPAASEGDPR